jgi:hypothetical protein
MGMLLCSAPVAQQSKAGIDPRWTKFCLKGQEDNAKKVCFKSEPRDGEQVELVDPETLAKQQAALQAELQRRAAEFRRRLEQRTQPPD